MSDTTSWGITYDRHWQHSLRLSKGLWLIYSTGINRDDHHMKLKNVYSRSWTKITLTYLTSYFWAIFRICLTGQLKALLTPSSTPGALVSNEYKYPVSLLVQRGHGSIRSWYAFNQGILKGEVSFYLLFDWFGLVCFANKNKNCQLS